MFRSSGTDLWISTCGFVAADTAKHPVPKAFDLKVFFTVVVKEPGEVTATDVLGFIEVQRSPRRGGNVVRLADGEAGLAASGSGAGWRPFRDCSVV